MTLHLYNYADKKYLLNKMTKIEKKAKKVKFMTIEPTIEQSNIISNIVLNFIRDNERIIYGGYALNNIISNIDKNDAIYDDENVDIADIDFYSPEPKNDIINICDILYSKGYKNIEGKEAQHKDTFTIFVGNEKYADISYMPDNIYKYLVKKSIKLNNIYHANPHFMLVDQFRMLNDPITSNFRWEKVIVRLPLILKHFPFKKIENKKFKFAVHDNNNSIKHFIKNFLSGKKTLIIFGIEAYNYYVSFTNGNLIDNIPYLELISSNYKEDIKKIIEYLENEYKNNEITVKYYYPFFQFYGEHIMIKIDGKPFIKIFEHNNNCIPYNVDNNNVRIAVFTYTIMMCLIMKIKSDVFEEQDIVYNYDLMISNLYIARNAFLKNKNLTILDESPYREFVLTCVGKTIDFTQMFVNRVKEMVEKGLIFFKYDPSNNDINKDIFFKEPFDIITGECKK